ncbi:MAG TPA: ATP cone domain-containing protein [Candidatus Hydrogenedens sp.]|nr:ATP cone domain-containing protein [Candidatus Hydrogenedens sp.]
MEPSRDSDKSFYLFDLFGLPSIPIHEAFRVKKRDGHIESFSLQKLSDSIKNALQSAGIEDNNLEFSLATAIKTYLRECHGLETIITSEEINSLTIQILREMGQKEALRNYMEFSRQKRLQQSIISKLKRVVPVPKKKNDDTTQELNLNIKQNFDELKKRITQILFPLNLSKHITTKIAYEAIEILNQFRYYEPSISFIKELCTFLLNRDGITYTKRELHVDLPAGSCIEIMAAYIDDNADPESTDRTLGKMVKEQISRLTIFSSEIIGAHDIGTIHLHSLEKIDRFYSLEQPAYYFWQFGKEELSFIQSPADFWSLMKDTYSDWNKFFFNPIVWWGFNWAIAPLVNGLEGNDYKNWIFQWIKECKEISYDSPGMQVILDWSLPKSWMFLNAYGDQRKDLGTPYINYKTIAQDLMLDILECVSQTKGKPTYPKNSILWRLNLPLEIDASSILWSSLVSCVEDNEIPVSLQFAPAELSKMIPKLELWGVTINLAQIAYNSTNEYDFYSGVYSACLLAIQACEEKLEFLLRYGCKAGVLWRFFIRKIFAYSKRRPTFASFPFNINISGLNECIHLLHKSKKQKPLELWSNVEIVIKNIRNILNSCSRGKNLNLHFALETNREILNEMVLKDIDGFSELLSKIGRDPYDIFDLNTGEITPLVFYNPEELVPVFDKLFAISSILDKPLQVRFMPNRVWDSLTLIEVIQLFDKMNKQCVPIQFQFKPSE